MTTITEDRNIEQEDYSFLFPPRAEKFNQPFLGTIKVQKNTENGDGIFQSGSTSSQAWVYTIPKTAEQHINLNDMFIQVAGKLKSGTAGSTRNWYPGNNWLLGMIEKSSFSLGGVKLFEENFSNRTSNIYAALANDREDLISGSLTKNGLQLVDYKNKSDYVIKEKFLGVAKVVGVTIVKNDVPKVFTLANVIQTAGTVFSNPLYKGKVFNATGLNAPILLTGGTQDNDAVCTSITAKINAAGTEITLTGTYDGVVTANVTTDKIDLSTVDVLTVMEGYSYSQRFNNGIEDTTIASVTDTVNFNVQIPLMQIFPGLVSIYPVFNQEIKIELNPRSDNKAVDINNGNITSNANVLSSAGDVLVDSINQNNLVYFAKRLSSEAKQNCLAYYSRNDVQTEFTRVQTINMKMSQSVQGGKETITSTISTDYSPILGLYAFPKANNRLSFHTSVAKGFGKTSWNGNDTPMQYEWYGSNNCSLCNMGLRTFKLQTSDGEILIDYDLSKYNLQYSNRSGDLEQFFCYDLTNNRALDYSQVYEDYRRARRFFGKQPEGSLTYDEFLKDYTVFCVDMTSFSLPRGSKIEAVIEYAAWTDRDYTKVGGAGATRISEGLLVLFGKKLLNYSDTGCSVSDIYLESQSMSAL